MTAPVFVVEHFDAGAPADGTSLDGPEGRHAVSVKRLRPGEEVVLTDGAGRWADVRGARRRGQGPADRPAGPVSEEPAPQPRITVVQALPKGDRGELAVETMTETGVDADRALGGGPLHHAVEGRAGAEGARQVAGHRARGRQAVPAAPLPRGRGRGDHQAGCRASRRSRLRRRAALRRERGSGHWPPPNSPPRARSCWSSAPKGASPRRSWRSSRRRARGPAGWGLPCCAPRPPGPRRRPCSWAAPAAGPDPGGTAVELAQVRLLVTDFAACYRFYAEVLGLKPQSGATDGPYEKFSPATGSAGIALQDRSMMAAGPGRTGRLGHRPPLPGGAARRRPGRLLRADRRPRRRPCCAAPPPMTDRMRVAHLKDPEGNLVELQEWLLLRG